MTRPLTRSNWSTAAQKTYERVTNRWWEKMHGSRGVPFIYPYDRDKICVCSPALPYPLSSGPPYLCTTLSLGTFFPNLLEHWVEPGRPGPNRLDGESCARASCLVGSGLNRNPCNLRPHNNFHPLFAIRHLVMHKTSQSDLDMPRLICALFRVTAMGLVCGSGRSSH